MVAYFHHAEAVMIMQCLRCAERISEIGHQSCRQLGLVSEQESESMRDTIYGLGLALISFRHVDLPSIGAQQLCTDFVEMLGLARGKASHSVSRDTTIHTKKRLGYLDCLIG
jgi:hypothetical protein